MWASPACEKPAIKHCLNEVGIDKGAHPGLGTLDCHVDGMHVTTVQADGLVISTPSGSTGYNLAAGGPELDATTLSDALSPAAFVARRGGIGGPAPTAVAGSPQAPPGGGSSAW